MRWAYLKNGDVVGQLARIRADSDQVRLGGADAFLAEFLRVAKPASLLLIGHGEARRDYRNAEVEAVSYPIAGRHVKKLGRVTAASVDALRRLIVFRPDRILCGRAGGLLWSATLAARILRVPLVHSRHNEIPDGDDPLARRLAARMDAWCMKRANSVICHGPYLRARLAQSGVDERRLFDFDVDLSEMLAVAPAARVDFEDANVVLYCGRLQEEKGIFDLLHAMRQPLLEDARTLLVYAGGGVHGARLRATVEALGLEGRVLMLGELSRDALIGVMRQSRMLVTPTRPELGEGRCMAAMEGLVQGVPVVAPDFGAFTYLVKPEVNGLSFEAGSVGDLRRQIERLLSDEALHERLARGARESGRAFCGGQRTFVQAVEQAFA